MTALLLIDIQSGLDEPGYYGSERNNPQAENNCRRILDYFRVKKWPVFHVQHSSVNPLSPLFPGKTGHQIKDIVKPLDSEPVIQKSVNSAFIGTELNSKLRDQEIKHLVLVGLTTDHCVSSTARMAANLGFHTTVISDATATFDKKGLQGQTYSAELMHFTCLASLAGEFADIMDTEGFLSKMEEDQNEDH